MDEPKQVVNMRLSKRVLTHFRAGGPGWQTRINAALESWLDQHPMNVEGAREPEAKFTREA